MTRETERELNKLVDRIRNYPPGFTFIVRYSDVPTRAKYNGLKWVLNKAMELGLIESISTGLSFESMRGETWEFANDETFKRKEN